MTVKNKKKKENHVCEVNNFSSKQTAETEQLLFISTNYILF